MPRQFSLSVLVPVFNEQYLLRESLQRLQVLRESPSLSRVQVVVVDDASTDRTPNVLESIAGQYANPDPAFEMVVLRHEKNMGKGAAIRTGLKYADGELTVIHDADLEYHPRDLLKMIALFESEGADAVFGSRFMAGEFKRALLFRHQLGNKLLTFFTDIVSDLNLTDIETCYKMVRTDLLKSIPTRSNDFRIEPELAIKLAKRGARVFEVPISYSGRTYIEGKKINWKDGFKALWAVLRFAVSDDLYTGDESGGGILERLSRAPRFNKWMANVVRPHLGDSVLEIGAGIGNLTVNLIPRDSYWATDINSTYLGDLDRLRPTRPYLHVTPLDLSDSRSFPNDKFDSVVCLNVVEHVQDDSAAMANIYTALRHGGSAVILVPHGPRIYGSLDQVLGHYRRYTRESITRLCADAGFRVKEIIEFNRVGWPAWVLNGKLLRRRTFGLGQIKLLEMLMPLFRRIDRVLPFPSLSLIAVVEKPAAAHGIAEAGEEMAARAV